MAFRIEFVPALSVSKNVPEQWTWTRLHPGQGTIKLTFLVLTTIIDLAPVPGRYPLTFRIGMVE